MTGFLEFIESHPQLLALLALFLPFIFPPARRWLKRMAMWTFNGRVIQKKILEEVTYIRKEMQFNGGNSVRDMLVIQVNRQKAQFWRSVKPSLEMDKDAQVHLVSETACQLVGIKDPIQLYFRNWLNFISLHAEEFLEAYANAVKFNSTINFRINIQNNEGEERGTWEMRLSPVTPPDSPRPLYSGYLRPVCSIAKQVSEELGT